MDAPTRVPTILFLISDTGAGHRSAANAICSAMNLLAVENAQEHPGNQDACFIAPITLPREGQQVSSPSHAPALYQMKIVDVFEECGLLPLRRTISLYGPAIKYQPELYGQLFHAMNHRASFKALQKLTHPLLQRGLVKLLTSVRPDVIVSVHPLLNHSALQVLAQLGVRVPFITVITDLVSVHRGWVAPAVDACVVPTDAARQVCLQHGMASEKIHLLGMPVDPRFSQPGEPKSVLRRQLGLDPLLPTILLVGGGEGTGKLYTSVRAISRARLPVQLIVVCGRNQRLLERLERIQQRLNVPAKLLGFVQNMPELMHAADVIVTKAGPGTICEALVCGLPIMLTSFVPGQEEGNVSYVLDNGVGRLTETPEKLVEALWEVLQPNAPALAAMRAQVARLSYPRASSDIASLILQQLPPDDSASVWNHSALAAARRAMRLRHRPVRARLGRNIRRLGRLSRLKQLDQLRYLLRRGTHLGNIQLRRSGSYRRRHDAWSEGRGRGR